MKKIITTIIIIIVIIAVGLTAYWYFAKSPSNPNPLSNINVGDFFPFGKPPESVTPETPSETPTTPEAPNINENPQENGGGLAVLPRLAKISGAEQAGATIYASSTETIVRFIDRQTGNVYEYNLTHPEKGRVRITNTTIPKIYSASWFDKGLGVLLGYLDDRSNNSQVVYGVVVPGKASSTDGVMYKELQTSFVGDSIHPLISPSLQKIAYLDTISGNSVLVVANKNGASSKSVATLPTSEWNFSWPNEASIVATTKPSATVPGYSYSINIATGALKKIIGGFNGLAVNPKTNPDTILYSYNNNNSPALKAYTLSTNKTEDTRFQTLAEKCVWGSGSLFYCGVPKEIVKGPYPDNWYMGDISFNDALWGYDIIIGSPKQIFDPKDMVNEEIDMIKMSIDSSGKYLMFTNKKDSSLWVYTL